MTAVLDPSFLIQTLHFKTTSKLIGSNKKRKENKLKI